MINVLIIDHAGTVRGVRSVLPETGIPGLSFQFTTCYRDILEGFRGDDSDVCVIDSATGNGPRLFAQARSLGYRRPVILVTSNDAGEAVNAIRSGIADCLIRDDLTAAGIERLICSVLEQMRESSRQTERAQRYLALIDNADDIIFTQDLEGNFTSINATGEQLTGYSQEEWSNLPVSQIVGAAHLDVAQQMIQQMLDRRQQTVCEIEIVTKHGQSVLVEATAHLVYQQGNAIEIQWIVRDANALKQSAGKLSRVSQLRGAAQSGAPSLAA
jgi:PAS domain S-box-containing protein